MRPLILAIATATAAVLAASCATATGSSHVDTNVDFARYRTFDWGAADAFPVGDPRLDRNATFIDHLQGAVEKQLAVRGLAHGTADGADLLIHFHASVDRRLEIGPTDARHGYCFDDNCRTGVRDYEAGTLIVDVVDRRTDKLIWRGWSQRSVDGVLDDGDRLARMINEGVAKMFVGFPVGIARVK
jgi:hypothetical protein